jgi:DNA mismatch repair protein MutL
MNKIRILPENLVNQIAAGEVVERPASVVKELIENSLDAGARQVRVEVENGGKKLIKVADDGCGMSKDDAVLAFERHATSKISKLEDLSAINTLGFRGEALSSIASVARVELVTKLEEELAATRVQVEGGRIIEVIKAARPRGTTVLVRDLFFNTPARRKFMRSEATENYHLTAVVQHYALAYPHVAFFLINNGREIFNLPPTKDLKDRIFQIFGAQLVENLLPVSGGDEFLARIYGFVSAPHERRSTRQDQFFFVNGRFVRDKVIASGVAEAFRSILPSDAYPVVFLFLQVPPEEVDVNVHPAKTEVRFRRKEAIREAITDSIRRALKSHASADTRVVRDEKARVPTGNPEHSFVDTGKKVSTLEFQKLMDFFSPIPSSEESKSETSVASDSSFTLEKVDSNHTLDDFSAESYTGLSQEQEVAATNEGMQHADSSIVENVYSSDFEKQAQATTSRLPEPEMIERQVVEDESKFDFPLPSAAKFLKVPDLDTINKSRIKPIYQIRESYIVAIDEKGLLLIDQHVAHERILFDKFRRAEELREIKTQNLLIPETVDLTLAESQIFDQIEPELEKQGFRIMKLSGRTIAIKGIPADLPPSEARALLIEILNSAKDGEFINAPAALKDEIAARLACRAAVKINTKLTEEQMQWLIDNLLETSSPTTCPHGRPIILRLSIKDIERGFHRK